MVVSTGTVCAFPYTSLASTPLLPSDCTHTYGEALGPAFIVLHALNVIASVAGMCILSLQFWRLKIYCEERKYSMWDQRPTVHFLFTFFFCMFWFLASVDLFGYWGFMPIEAYAIFDDCVGACGISNFILVTHFIGQVAQGVKKADTWTRVTNVLVKVALVSVWIDFVGFTSLAVSFSEFHGVFAALKRFGGVFILVGFMIVSTFFANIVRKTMVQTVEMTHSESSKSELLEMVATLRRKQARMIAVCSVTSLALFVSAILTVSQKTRRWTITFADSPNLPQVVFCLIYLLVLVTCVYIFRVPNDGQASRTSKPSLHTSTSAPRPLSAPQRTTSANPMLPSVAEPFPRTSAATVNGPTEQQETSTFDVNQEDKPCSQIIIQ